MNTNEVSFNFDDYIESNFKKESKNEPIIEKEEQYYICPVCGNYNRSKISRNYWLFESKCRNNAEITYTQRLQIASYFP